MANGSGHRDVLEFLTRRGVTEQQAAAAHVAAADEFAREEQSLAKDARQRLDVLVRRDAPQEHGDGSVTERARQLPRIRQQRALKRIASGARYDHSENAIASSRVLASNNRGSWSYISIDWGTHAIPSSNRASG